ncbi:ScyD/ScyE family protein [Intrasporangium calvum]|uniref:ScyD/ScyE family protein n=1 Tax=Intrasporangium calvum TaxID=53358 RepID=A0ABT5GMR8_9MICO|nr:ScyD/ScyE family protein [Intrasporangium calvum]MDC5699175.1 ScyD/ScyE family protein [Intrasporangium calvum]
MTRHHSVRLMAVGAATLLLAATGSVTASAGSHVTVIASGLNSPRQLAFSPGGGLYVAEAGTAGNPADSPCQEHPEFGEVCFGFTGSVSKVDPAAGGFERVLEGLPSAGSPADAIGPGDIAFTGNHQFALTIGLGGSPEYRAGYGPDAALLGTVVTGDLRHLDGLDSLTEVFDATAYEAEANPDATDIDSNPVGLATWGNGWVVADAGANAVVSTRKGGSTVAVLDPVPTVGSFPFPGFPADAVPTDVVRGPDGAWYVSQLVGFPFEPGSSTIWRVVPGQAPTAWATGLTNVTSLAFAADGTLYAVEIASNGLFAGPFGSLVQVHPGSSTHHAVASGLFAPYGVAIRGEYAYVTTGSVAAGGGQVLRIAR